MPDFINNNEKLESNKDSTTKDNLTVVLEHIDEGRDPGNFDLIDLIIAEESSKNEEKTLNESDSSLKTIAMPDEELSISDSDFMSVSSDDVLQAKKEAEAINNSDTIDFLSTKDVEDYLNALSGHEVWQDETMEIPKEVLEFVLPLLEDSKNQGAQPMEVGTDSEQFNLTDPKLKNSETEKSLESGLTEIGTEMTLSFRSKEEELDEDKCILEKIKQFLALFYFKKANSDEGNGAYVSIIESFPRIKRLLNSEMQLEPGSLQQWWNEDAGIKKPSFNFIPFHNSHFFKLKLKSQSNGDIVQQLLNCPKQSELLENKLPSYLEFINQLEGFLHNQQISKYCSVSAA